MLRIANQQSAWACHEVRCNSKTLNNGGVKTTNVLVIFTPPSLRVLLLQRTSWHAHADCWLAIRNISPHNDPPLEMATSHDELQHLLGNPPWTINDEIALPQSRTNVVYLIESAPSTSGLQRNAICYIGSTNDMQRRLQDHKTGRGAKQTKGRSNWVVKGLVMGFHESDCGNRKERCHMCGRCDAFAFELEWRRVPWHSRSTTRDRLRIARLLIHDKIILQAQRLQGLYVVCHCLTHPFVIVLQ